MCTLGDERLTSTFVSYTRLTCMKCMPQGGQQQQQHNNSSKTPSYMSVSIAFASYDADENFA